MKFNIDRFYQRLDFPLALLSIFRRKQVFGRSESLQFLLDVDFGAGGLGLSWLIFVLRDEFSEVGGRVIDLGLAAYLLLGLLVLRFHSLLDRLVEGLECWGLGLVRLRLLGCFLGGRWPADLPGPVEGGFQQQPHRIYQTSIISQLMC